MRWKKIVQGETAGIEEHWGESEEFGNLVQWKLPRIYESYSRQDSW